MAREMSCKPAKGSPPTLEWVALDQLMIDEAYQRSLENKSSITLIRNIATAWDWGLCQPLAVSRREDGRLFVVDGQHRLAAARLRGDLPHLPCVVSARSSAAEEAHTFVALNRNRRALNAVDVFKAALAAGDGDSREIMALINGAGLSVAPHQNWYAWKPKQLYCIPTIQAAYRTRGRIITSAALVALAEAWPGQPLRFAARVLQGLVPFFAEELKDQAAFDPDVFDEVLPSQTQAEWVAQAQLHGATHGTNLAVAMHALITERYIGLLSKTVELEEAA